MCVVGGGWTEDRRPVLLLKPDLPPLGTLQCVGQPQGVCEGGPWGAEENVRARPLGWAYQRVHQPPRPYLLPEMSVQMAMCQGGGCRLKVGGQRPDMERTMFSDVLLLHPHLRLLKLGADLNAQSL